MPKGIPLTEEELNRRRHEIFNASVSLFIKKGFLETSMQEIALVAGMGKSSLYDYFKNKDEILISVIEDEIYDVTERAKCIADQDLTPAEKLKQIMRAHLQYLLENKDLFSILMFEAQRLGIASQHRVQVKRHAYQDLLCNLIAQAIQDGTFRPITPLLAARTLLYLLTPTVFTTRPTGTPEEMMEETIDFVYRGLLA